MPIAISSSTSSSSTRSISQNQRPTAVCSDRPSQRSIFAWKRVGVRPVPCSVVTAPPLPPERVAARLIITKLVERGAGGGQHHRLARLGGAGGAAHGLVEHPAFLDHRHLSLEQPREHRACFADGIGGADVIKIGCTGVELVGFRRPPKIQWIAGNAASAGAVDVGLVALLSLTNNTPSFVATRSIRCGRPGNVSSARSTAALSMPKCRATAIAASAFCALCGPCNAGQRD